MNEFDFLNHEKLGDRLYVVRESFDPKREKNFNIFVVVGDDKVGVFDAGLGVTGGLRRYIEENITDKKPMVCYITHGDLDHFGACTLFDEVYMNEREMRKLEWNLNVERRFSDLKMFCRGDEAVMDFCRDRYVRNQDVQVKNIKDGDVIDLGGVQFLVVRLPGHTPGAVAYYNKADNYAFMGDSVLVTSSWARCRDMQECLDCHTRFMEMIPEDITLYSGHGRETQGVAEMRDLKTAFEDILAGRNEGDEPFTLAFEFVDPEELAYDVWKHHHGSVDVVYDANVVKEK